MRDFESIIKNPVLSNIKVGTDGGRAEIFVNGWRGIVIWSDGAGWGHVSVSANSKKIVPSWNDMCFVKDIFFTDDEAVIEIHPKKSEYVNNVNNCLHLWRCKYREMVLPPSCLVGVRDGITRAEYMKELKEAYELAGEKYD